jgi:hypothetical protein
VENDFATEMRAFLGEEGGDDGTPPTPAAAETALPEASDQQPAGDEPQGTPESGQSETSRLDDLRQKYGAEVVDEIYRHTDAELKRGLTPRLQEAAEIKQQLEARAAALQFYDQVEQLATWDPAAAQRLWEAGGRQVFGQHAPPPPAQPEPEPEFYSDRERELWLANQQTQQELAEMRTWRQQEQQARNMAQISEKFARLETEIGRDIPLEERNQVAAACMKMAKRASDGTTLLPEVDMVWWYLNRNKVMQTARSEASSVVERKAGIGNGPSTLARGDTPPREPTSLEDALRADPGFAIG